MNHDIINEAKKEANGFTQRDMTLYLVKKIDHVCDQLGTLNGKLDDKIAKNEAEIARINGSLGAAYKIVTIILSILGLAITVLAAKA